MSKKSKKGRTMALTDYLASEPKLVTVRDSTWAAIVDEEEQKKPIVVDMSGLPTAPRSAVDIDFSTVPNSPPFVIHVANLSFEIDDEGLRRIFADLKPKAARIMRDGIRSRGIGLVEFETRENLIEALKRTDKEIYGRKIRINVSDKTDLNQIDNSRTNFFNRSNRTIGDERPEMSDRWKRKSNDSTDDRQSSAYHRDRPNRNEQGRSNFPGGPRNGQRGSDYGYGYPRTRDERMGSNRDHGTRQRYNHDDENRQNNDTDRSTHTDRYNDTRDKPDRNTTNDDNREPPRERPRLHLQPRSKPLEEFKPLSGSSSSVNNVAATSSSIANTEDSPSINEHLTNDPIEYQQQESNDTSEIGSSIEKSTGKPLVPPSRGAGTSIFGGAKPVDTAAKELEIQKRLEELQMANTETGRDHYDKGPSSRSSYFRGKRSSINDDHHNRDRRDDGRASVDYHHKREYSGGRRYEDDSRRSSHDDNYRRDRERDRYNNPSRRDYDSGRTGKYNHHGHSDRDNYQNRDRETNESNSHRRLSDDNFDVESQSKNQIRIMPRRTIQTEDNSNRLQLSNKFDMLNIDDPDDNAQSRIIHY
ncbi:unnamed protein product [Rotaria sordida]|uniref:RRM domain-containing protein n=3 Tax=Rotaria sordida TaxID=392033 RepID=A0A819KNG9_9BILA|nr:unnamed protein product [Rotaria sordida]